MEKIQTAIAKARAERNGGHAIGAADRNLVHRDTTTTEAVAAVWERLPTWQTDPDLMRRNRIVSFEGGQDASEMDMLRTRVLQQMRANNWRRLAISSPTAACGKSTIALNLALSLSRQQDLRILLLELDLRRPSLAKMLGITQNVSFSEVLRGKKAFSECGIRIGGNMAVGVNTNVSRNTSELLSSAYITEALSEIDTSYDPDITIFDMPPMLATDDVMAFAKQVDCVLIIAAADSTAIKEIAFCEQELARETNIMGVVLNKCRYMGPAYGYGYY